VCARERGEVNVRERERGERERERERACVCRLCAAFDQHLLSHAALRGQDAHGEAAGFFLMSANVAVSG
jgi:hypothetical protein